MGPTDVHPSPAPHFKTFQVFMFYFPKCPSFSTTQGYTPIVEVLILSDLRSFD
jgi:hypothetical protein